MARRLVRTAEEMAVDEPGRRLLERAHALAMEPRRERLPDDHHPDYLHPGRSALVLLLDARHGVAETLAAAALVESEHPELRVSADRIHEVLGPEVVDRVERVPLRGSDPDRLLEDLVAADRDTRLAALAERLDHLRHAHLRESVEERRQAHEEARAIYRPVAHRTDPMLARRYDWWCRMFGRRWI